MVRSAPLVTPLLATEKVARSARGADRCRVWITPSPSVGTTDQSRRSHARAWPSPTLTVTP